MANSTIIAQSFTSKNGNKVWKVTVEGSNDAEQTMYCKSPLTAIRGMYIMRGRIEGSVISDNCMTKLCNEHYKAKLQKLNPQEAEETAEEIQQQAEVQTPEEEPKPKAKRGRKPKKQVEEAAA